MLKTLKILLIYVLTFSLFSANAENLENINVIDTKTINASVTDGVLLSEWEVNWDIKILRDIEVNYSSLDLSNPRKVSLSLSADLYTNSDYSLISVVWAEWSIDFTIWESLNSELDNYYLDVDNNIEKIVILDSRTIDVYYNYDLTENEFEYKLLGDLSVKSLSSDWDSNFNINLNTDLEQNRNYIVMVISLEDNSGSEIPLDESLFEFSTDNSLVENWAVVEEDIVKQEVIEDEYITEDIQTVLNEKEENESNGNIEEVSLNAASTPETGPETIFLIILTIILSLSFFYFRKTKS